LTTALQLVNQVLRRLRQDQVSDFTENYTQLVLDFVNLAKHEVENAGPWRALRAAKTVATVAGTSTYTLATTNERTYVLKDAKSGIAMAWRTDAGNTHPIGQSSLDQLQLQQGVVNPSNSEPIAFAPIPGAAGLGIQLYPKPDGVYNYTFTCIVPQADFTAVTDVLSVPTKPVVELAVWHAINERGEGLGEEGQKVLASYRSLLEAAVLSDFGAEPQGYVPD
jgi:hypothetical protein